MQRSAWKDIANWPQQLYKFATPCIDDHHFEEEEDLGSVGECQNYALKLS